MRAQIKSLPLTNALGLDTKHCGPWAAHDNGWSSSEDENGETSIADKRHDSSSEHEDHKASCVETPLSPRTIMMDTVWPPPGISSSYLGRMRSECEKVPWNTRGNHHGGVPFLNEATLLDEVSSAIDGEKAAALFACGGSLPITNDCPPDDCSACRPVQISWATAAGDRLDHLELPLDANRNRPNSFERLAQDCQSATFGRGKEDVLDETYRKAKKLNASQFLTNFNHYEVGIIDSVAQVLVPTIGDCGTEDLLGIVAELYSLNVYSGPSGKFRPHVDTPRSAKHFGSLVVSLPCAHTGGALAVRHEGQEVVFD